MNFKKVCPRDCPGRYPGCVATCPTWKEHRAEALKLYEEREKKIKIADFLRDGYDMRRRRY